uniref:Putative DNA binding, helix-turn-helix domain containing protein n=1 Tax=viral metagenome TaxID=1070528 RepID=A0A6M3M5S4_9ZZZZ
MMAKRGEVLKWMEEYSKGYSQAAQYFGISANTVKSWVRRDRIRTHGLMAGQGFRNRPRMAPKKTNGGSKGNGSQHVKDEGTEPLAKGLPAGGNGGPPATPLKPSSPPAGSNGGSGGNGNRAGGNGPEPPTPPTPPTPPAPTVKPSVDAIGNPLEHYGLTKFNEQTRAVALQVIRLGGTRAYAARAARVALGTFDGWLRRGRSVRTRLQRIHDAGRPLPHIDDTDSTFLGFLADYEHAEAQAVQLCLASVLKQIKGNDEKGPDGRLGLAFLKARWGSEFVDRMDVSVTQDGTVDHRFSFDFSRDTPEQLAEKRRQVEELKKLKKLEAKGMIINARTQPHDDEE